jgi:hypothetical protein
METITDFLRAPKRIPLLSSVLRVYGLVQVRTATNQLQCRKENLVRLVFVTDLSSS